MNESYVKFERLVGRARNIAMLSPAFVEELDALCERHRRSLAITSEQLSMLSSGAVALDDGEKHVAKLAGVTEAAAMIAKLQIASRRTGSVAQAQRELEQRTARLAGVSMDSFAEAKAHIDRRATERKAERAAAVAGSPQPLPLGTTAATGSPRPLAFK